MLKRQRVNLHQVLKATEVYHQIPVRFTDVELEESLKTAAELDICAYDAYLIRCALKYNVPLISLDKNLAKAGNPAGQSPRGRQSSDKAQRRPYLYCQATNTSGLTLECGRD